MSAAKRKVYGAAFKGKVGLEAIRGAKTINEIAQEHGVHPAQVGQWKKAIQEQVGTLFEGKYGGPMESVQGTAPSPLILQLVKTVLRIRPITVQLRDTQNAFGNIGHQYRVFIDLGLSPIHKGKFQLAFFLPGGDQVFLQQTPKDDDTATLLPSGPLNLVLAAFPALSGIPPIALREGALQQALDAR
ncbi:MAG: transposase, partial [Acidithiobacillus sp.]|jgi:transposase-like protein|uniref:transposase n=1 Tax=Acidithiobacillus sp. TaxID=1872118 RepID=UPI00355EB9B1